MTRFLLQFWSEHHLLVITVHQLAIGGDGRADSPRHSAKFGSYTAMDLDSNLLVVNIELVQSNEVSNSNTTEKEGLVRTAMVCNWDHW